MSYYKQVGHHHVLAEVNRISSENRKLAEMLTIMFENYNALQSQMSELMSKNISDNEQVSLTPRKRKADGEDHNNAVNGLTNNGSNIECSSSDEECSCKLPREFKSKTSTIYVQTDSNDKTLVSF